ncbi:MAG: hypothetical protein ACRDI2_18355 [Chloroflexota bacterium]
MPDTWSEWSEWSVGFTAAALVLRTRGFSPREADRLVVLRQRYERGEFRAVPIEQKRKEFAKWLVEHGRLTDYAETAETAAYGVPCALPGAPGAPGAPGRAQSAAHDTDTARTAGDATDDAMDTDIERRAA